MKHNIRYCQLQPKLHIMPYIYEFHLQKRVIRSVFTHQKRAIRVLVSLQTRNSCSQAFWEYKTLTVVPLNSRNCHPHTSAIPWAGNNPIATTPQTTASLYITLYSQRSNQPMPKQSCGTPFQKNWRRLNDSSLDISATRTTFILPILIL